MSDRPTIAQILPALETGGVERGTVDVAAAAAAAGWQSIVISDGGQMVREVLRAGAAHIQLPLRAKNPLTLKRNAERLAEAVAKHGIDILHARSRAPAWSAKWAAQASGARFVTTFHGAYNRGFPGKAAYNAVMVGGERVIAISDFIRGHIVKHYRVDPAVIRVIHRGIDMDIFDPAAVTPERLVALARRWRLPDDRPVVMLPGRITRWKGHLLLIRALRRLGRDDLRVLIVGSDAGHETYRGEIEEAAERAGLAGVVQVTGPCNDMAAAYMLADVVVSASIDPEAFGRVTAEGQAMGRLVVAPAHGAAPEQIEPQRTGWLFRPDDADSLASALGAALALDPARRKAMAQAAQASARARFSKPVMCAKVLDVYREVLAAEKRHWRPDGQADAQALTA